MKREEAHKRVEDGLAELNTALAGGRSERLTEYLDVMSRFHRYSFRNLMLILAKNPESSDYIRLYRAGPETLAESLHAIQSTATSIIEAISRVEIDADKKEAA